MEIGQLETVTMDAPRSEKIRVEPVLIDKALKNAGAFSAATSVAPSLYEKGGVATEVTDAEMFDVPPDGGRGWLVILGCVIYSAATSGWGYVLVLVHTSCCSTKWFI